LPDGEYAATVVEATGPDGTSITDAGSDTARIGSDGGDSLVESFSVSPVGIDSAEVVLDPTSERLSDFTVGFAGEDPENTIEVDKSEFTYDDADDTYRWRIDSLDGGMYTASLTEAVGPQGTTVTDAGEGTVRIQGDGERLVGIGEPTFEDTAAPPEEPATLVVPVENDDDPGAAHEVELKVLSEGEGLAKRTATVEGETARDVTLDVPFEAAGTYPLTVEVSSDTGWTDTFERELTVGEDAPTASATLTPESVEVGTNDSFVVEWEIPEAVDDRSMTGLSAAFGSDWSTQNADESNVSVSVNGESAPLDWTERYDGTLEIGLYPDPKISGGDTVTARIGTDGTGAIGTPETAGEHGVELTLRYEAGDDGTWTDTADVTVEPPAGTAEVALEPQDATASLTNEVTYDVVVRNANDGLGLFYGTVNVGDGARVVDAAVAGDPAGATTDVTDDGGSVSFETYGLGIEDTGDGTTVATVTVRAVGAGTTDVTLADVEVADRPGTAYENTTADGTLTGVDIDPVGPFENPPTDSDHDGVFEDVNGDGRANIVDVQAFFENQDDDAVTAHPSRFDFNDDGRYSPSDIQALFSELGGTA
jgi:hypothetical protein